MHRNEIFVTWAIAMYLLWLFPYYLQDLTKFQIHYKWSKMQYIFSKANELQTSKPNLFELVTPRKICRILNVDAYLSEVAILLL